jgi:threonine dehydrogenase-like Zn-dependent dehydrogenase
VRAVTLHPSEKRVAVEERAAPPLESPTAVRLRVLDVGVCGTDAELCSFQYGEPPAGEDALVLGHEALARVVEVGARVKTLARGDLVVPMVRRPCPHASCAACRSGNQDFCETGDYTERGIKGAGGFLAEEVVEEERYLVPVPPALRPIAVLTEPLTIAEKALRQYADVQRRLPWAEWKDDDEMLAGRRAVVLGAGPVGILGCMLLTLRGLQTVVYSRGKKPNAKAALVEAVGAEYVSSEEERFPDLARRLGGVDLVYEAAGASQLAFDVLPHLTTNAVFIFTGVPGRKQQIEVAGDAIMKNVVLQNQVVLGTVNASRADFERAVADLAQFVERWPDATRSIISGRFPMDSFCEQAGAHEGIKRVITVGEEGAGAADSV